MRRFISIFIILIAGWQWSMAQDVSKFKILNDSAYQSSNEYMSGNKYQKDAILFMDMVAETHPYYIKVDRRAEWFNKKNTLLEQCGTIQNDEDFVDALIDVLGPLHDKHTDLTTLSRLQENKIAKSQESEAAAAADKEHVMSRHDSFYDYRIFPQESICYLQFNRYQNAEYFVSVLNGMTGKTTIEGLTIQPKSITGNAFDINESQKSRLKWTFCLIVPACVLIVGIIVWVRRKNR